MNKYVLAFLVIIVALCVVVSVHADKVVTHKTLTAKDFYRLTFNCTATACDGFGDYAVKDSLGNTVAKGTFAMGTMTATQYNGIQNFITNNLLLGANIQEGM